MKKTLNFKDQNGQTLIFVAATMVVALAVGVGVALRSLSSISRVSTTDTASRALAAAEGGAEKYLALSEYTLSQSVSGTCPSGTTASTTTTNGCEILFEGTSQDSIDAKATVVVEQSPAIVSGDSFITLVPKDNIAEIDMAGYSSTDVGVCWMGTGGEPYDSDIYYMAYGESGGDIVGVRGGVLANNSREDAAGESYETNFASADPGSSPYTSCYTITNLPNTVLGLRILVLNTDSQVGIFPLNGASLPSQGFDIISVGELANVESAQKAMRTVKVFRSKPYLPGIMNFGVFSGSSPLP
jgi:hypothetical protein